MLDSCVVLAQHVDMQIRNHAAAALSNLGQRHLYANLWEAALETTFQAAIKLHSSKGGSDESAGSGVHILQRSCFISCQ